MSRAFFGRDREIGRLEALYSTPGFVIASVEGPRGCGKTSLMREFCRGRRAVPFTAVAGGRDRNLAALSTAVSKSMYKGLRSLVRFSSFQDAAGFVSKLSEKGRIVLVVDGYDRFSEDDDPVAEAVRSGAFRGSDVMLVLVGSTGCTAGRRYGTALNTIGLGPLRFSEVVQAFPFLSPEDAVGVYAVTGGEPSMISSMDVRSGVQRGIDRLLLSPDGAWYRDPLSRTSLRGSDAYVAILSSIESGMLRMGDIVERSGIGSAAACSTYLSSLVREGVAERLSPYGEPDSRRSMYRIRDPAARLWYSFVEGNQSIIDYRAEDDLYGPLASAGMDALVRSAFRSICVQFIEGNHAFFDMAPGEIGMWWGSDGRRSMDRIDIVVESDDRSQTLFCDCRYRDSAVGLSVLDELEEKSTRVRAPGKRRYALFSKGGFTPELEACADERDATLVSLKDICWYR